MAWRGSFSRSFINTARASAFRPRASTTHIRPPPFSAATRPRFSFANPRTLGELGCMQSLMPLSAGALLTSHLAVSPRACCELYHGTFCRSCQDR